MQGLIDAARHIWKIAWYALSQMTDAVPGYWDSAVGAVARAALAAFPLLAAVLLAALAALPFSRQEKRVKGRRAAALAGTLAVAVGLSLWAHRAVPVAQEGTVASVALVQVRPSGTEREQVLTAGQQNTLAQLLEKHGCRAALESTLPEAGDGAAYRLTVKTVDGKEFVLWVTQAGAFRYTGKGEGLLYTVFSSGELYDALTAL